MRLISFRFRVCRTMPCQLLSLDPCVDWACWSAIAIAFSLEPRRLLDFGRRGGLPNLTERAGLSTCPRRHRDLRQTACRGRRRHVIGGGNEKTGGTHGRGARCADLAGLLERAGRVLMSVNSKR